MNMQGIPQNLLSQLTPQQQQVFQQFAQLQAQKPALAAAFSQAQQQNALASAAKPPVFPNAQQPAAPTPRPAPGPTITTNTNDAAAAAKRGKKRKATDKEIPDKVAISIPESEAFNTLLKHQRSLDAMIQQKHSEIKEALQLPEHVKRKLRLYVYNTHHHQRPTGSETRSQQQPSEPASWTLHISGRVLDPEPAAAAPAPSTGLPNPLGGPPLFPPPFGQPLGQPAQQPGMPGLAGRPPAGPVAGPSAAPPGHKHGATFFFRRVEVKLDPKQYPGDSGVIVWEKAQHVGTFKDDLEIKRLGSQPCTATVTIELDWQPERFMLDPRLATVLKLQYETKARILKAFWLYIKRHRLQDPKQPQQLHLPMELAQVLGTSSVQLAEVSDHLQPLLTEMKPVVIEHTIKVDGASPSLTHCYDVDVEVPTAQPSDKIAEFIDRFSRDQELEAMDQKLSGIIQRINEHKRRRDFYLGLAHSPTDFINALVASQARDMRQGKSASGNDFEVERRTDLFRQPWAQEAVIKYLQKRLNRMG